MIRKKYFTQKLKHNEQESISERWFSYSAVQSFLQTYRSDSMVMVGLNSDSNQPSLTLSLAKMNSYYSEERIMFFRINNAYNIKDNHDYFYSFEQTRIFVLPNANNGRPIINHAIANYSCASSTTTKKIIMIIMTLNIMWCGARSSTWCAVNGSENASGSDIVHDPNTLSVSRGIFQERIGRALVVVEGFRLSVKTDKI